MGMAMGILTGDPNHDNSFGIAAGAYQGSSAFAFGFSHYFERGDSSSIRLQLNIAIGADSGAVGGAGAVIWGF